MRSSIFEKLLSVRGLITVPGAIAIALWMMSFPLLWLDARFDDELVGFFGEIAKLPYETARPLLTTIAAAAITTLSLVYSIVLVVFTLAAGTIAPRLLKWFTADKVNQVTAGMFGGTFLFALTVL